MPETHLKPSLPAFQHLSHDHADIVVGDAWTGRQTEAAFEERFAYAVHITRIVAVDRLQMHRFPDRSRFDARFVECQSHCLNIPVRFAIRMQRCRLMRYACSSANSPIHSHFVSMFFAFDMQILVDHHRVQPVVAVVAIRRIHMKRYSLHAVQQ